MTRRGIRIGALAGALVLAGATLVLPAGAREDAGASSSDLPVHAPRAFSPNGDGVKDSAPVRYSLDRPGDVVVEVRGPEHERPLVLRRHLGRQDAGDHVWSWDGGLFGGKRPVNAQYQVLVLSGGARGVREVEVDRRFRVWVDHRPSYGAPGAALPVVYPQTSVVRDHVGLEAFSTERRVTAGRLLLRDPAGRVVATAPFARLFGGPFFGVRLEWQGRAGDGRPLPAGTYSADVRGTDLAGNSAVLKKAFSVRVSDRSLLWRDESRVVQPVASRVTLCGLSSANGCDESQCGTVLPSARYPGGLSLRSAACADTWKHPGAWTFHRVAAADAVRGIDSYRVGFGGTPTAPGETDVLTMHAGQVVVGASTSAWTPWLTEGPYLDGAPRDWIRGIPRVPPSVDWWVETRGDDSFDVESFTVDLRYLVVAP